MIAYRLVSSMLGTGIQYGVLFGGTYDQEGKNSGDRARRLFQSDKIAISHTLLYIIRYMNLSRVEIHSFRCSSFSGYRVMCGIRCHCRGNRVGTFRYILGTFWYTTL